MKVWDLYKEPGLAEGTAFSIALYQRNGHPCHKPEAVTVTKPQAAAPKNIFPIQVVSGQ